MPKGQPRASSPAQRPTIACIVEGHGEEEAVPVLIRRIAAEINPGGQIGELIRVTKTLLLRPGELEKRVTPANRKSGTGSRVLVVIDADDDRPQELIEQIERRLRTAAPHIKSAVAVAVKEFESWFIAGVEGIRGCRGVSQQATPISVPESKRDAKGWLSGLMPADHPYSETLHQAAFTAVFDIVKARQRSPSFDHCYREIEHLLTSE